MLLQKMMVRLRRIGARRAPSGVHSVEQLRWVLERERARSDRGSRVFSLLAFTLRDRGVDVEALESLLRILQDRLRFYDEVGWLEDGRIGVVLPDTPGAGAWKVADDVVAAYPLTFEPPLCQVYTYPSDWAELGDGEIAAPESGESKQRPARRMEPLFVRRMPLWKRGLDVAGALAGLMLFLPALVVAAIAVRLSSPGPVLFAQWRAGAGNRRFKMYKFRTMQVDAERRKQELRSQNEQDGPAFKIKHDPRVTRVGRFLRRTSIDELPQFWNVLKGDMSLVGPRPLPCDEAEACHRWQKRRLDVTPGLTCIWQVKGRSRVSFDDWVRMDVQYIRSRSVWSDLKLLVQTVLVVVLGKGAY